MKPDLVLGKKYRVSNHYHTEEGILTGIGLCRVPLVNRFTSFKYRSLRLKLTEEYDGQGVQTAVWMFGPWDLIEEVNMSPVIYEPPETHDCQPPIRLIGYGGSMTPAYQTDTVWACDVCGQRWIVETDVYSPPAWGMKPREVSTWVRHDKDTP